MIRDRYWHGFGFPLPGSPGSYRLESGVVLTERLRPDATLLTPKSRVVIAWKSDSEYPPLVYGFRFIDSDAVEVAGQWLVISRYRAKFDRPRDVLPYAAEDVVIRHLSVAGIRVEKSTAFEDEILGIDFWVFLTIRGSWTWLPVDLTIQSGVYRPPRSKKYSVSLKKRVLPIFVEPYLAAKDSDKIAERILGRILGIRGEFQSKGVKLRTRQEARREELRYYG